ERLATSRPRPGHRPVSDSRAEQGEVSTQVAHAVATLTDDQREVVILRHYHDLSCREIAEILQTPYTTVRSRLVQGLNELRLKLRDLNPCICS
ncbi:MAG: RNA polymerase sigma factor, partial [Planctomycetes bacterium]|nr:RNA polymerase sigma factor [Planctomycetota bacterium]